MVLEELQTGEEPVSFDTKRPNTNHAAFRDGVVSALAWANEIPPEVLMLQFQNNYSASKAATQEFRAYLTKRRALFGNMLCRPFYLDWLHVELLRGTTEAKGLLEAWHDPGQYDVFGAWTRHSWGGPVKPSIELGKDVKAYTAAIDAGLISADRASTDLFGVRYSRVVKRLAREKTMRDDAGLEPDAPEVPGVVPGAVAPPPVVALSDTAIEAVADRVIDLFDDDRAAGAA
jgi:capsid protein